MQYLKKINFKQRRWLLVIPILLAMIAAASFFVVNQHSTRAASTADRLCSQNTGGLIERDYITASDGTTKIGEMDVFYNSSNGYNCAYVYALGHAIGVAKQMGVQLIACQETSRGDTCTETQKDTDLGTYRYYAGVVGVYGRGHCIRADGGIVWQGQPFYAHSSPIASHCGN